MSSEMFELIQVVLDFIKDCTESVLKSLLFVGLPLVVAFELKKIKSKINQLNSNQPYGNQPYSNQPYGNQPYSNQPYSNQPYGNQPYGNQPYSNQPYSNQNTADTPVSSGKNE